MPRDARIDLDWADDTYSFRLGWSELEKLQEATDAGPYVVFGRLGDGTWRIEDISHTIRLGLIGGGMTPADALKKVRAYVEDRPPMESILVARTVLGAGLLGSEDEPLGGADAVDQANP